MRNGTPHGLQILPCTLRLLMPATPPVAATPMAFARVIAAAMTRGGLNPAEALKQAQITPARLAQADARIPLAGARFPFAAPAHSEAYRFMFPGGPLEFDADHAAIAFDARYLQLPLRRDEKALRQMLKRALPLTVLQYRRDRLLVEQVRQALLEDPSKAHSAQGLAGLLHMSTRTLHRQLKEEGASLQQLKDEVRCERAKDLLYRTSKPVKQVAAATGFRNEKSFIRAFKQWTGLSPAEFRRTG